MNLLLRMYFAFEDMFWQILKSTLNRAAGSENWADENFSTFTKIGSAKFKVTHIRSDVILEFSYDEVGDSSKFSYLSISIQRFNLFRWLLTNSMRLFLLMIQMLFSPYCESCVMANVQELNSTQRKRKKNNVWWLMIYLEFIRKSSAIMLKPVNQNEIRILKSFFFLSGFPFFFPWARWRINSMLPPISYRWWDYRGHHRQKMSGLGTLKLKNH